MAKGKSSGKSGYTSAGVHRNVSKKTTNALRSEYLKSGERVINQLKAFRAGKRVMVTIENPNKNETNKRFIRVEASTIWKRLPKPGSGVAANA
jgi:hypothetical protein